MSYQNNKLSELIEGQLPNFLLEEGPKFVKFVEKYYEWLETSKLEVFVSEDLNLDFSKSIKIMATQVIIDNSYGIKHVYAEVINSYKIDNGNYVFFIKEYNQDPNSPQTRGFLSDDKITFVEGYDDFSGTIKVVSYIQNLSLSSKNIWNLQDIDRTLDEYVDYFMKEYLEGYPLVFPTQSDSSDLDIPEFKKFLVKRSREFYQSKGTEDSFKYFFRTIFNDEISIYYPKEDLLKLSDNTFLRTKTILLKPESDNIPDIVSQKIIGKDSSVIAYVESVVRIKKGRYDILQIELNEFGIVGDFLEGEQVILENGTVIGNVYYGAVSVDIYDVQESFELEQKFFINRNGEIVEYEKISNIDRGTFIELRVCDINAGKITGIEVVDGGYDYSVGNKLTFDNTNCFTQLGPSRPIEAIVSKVDGNGKILEIKVLCDGKGYVKYPSITKIGDTDVTSESFNLIGKDVGTLKKVKIHSQGIGYTGSSYEIDLSSNDVKNIKINLGSIFDDGGRFQNNNSFVSDIKYLQDSRYYQTYSYLIQSAFQTIHYQDLLKRLVHPAGLGMFGSISTKSQEQAKMTAKMEDIRLPILIWDNISKYSDSLIEYLPGKIFDLLVIDGDGSSIDNSEQEINDTRGSKDGLIPNIYYQGSYADDFLSNENTYHTSSYKIKYKNLRPGTMEQNEIYNWKEFNLIKSSIEQNSNEVELSTKRTTLEVEDWTGWSKTIETTTTRTIYLTNWTVNYPLVIGEQLKVQITEDPNNPYESRVYHNLGTVKSSYLTPQPSNSLYDYLVVVLDDDSDFDINFDLTNTSDWKVPGNGWNVNVFQGDSPGIAFQAGTVSWKNSDYFYETVETTTEIEEGDPPNVGEQIIDDNGILGKLLNYEIKQLDPPVMTLTIDGDSNFDILGSTISNITQRGAVSWEADVIDGSIEQNFVPENVPSELKIGDTFSISTKKPIQKIFLKNLTVEPSSTGPYYSLGDKVFSSKQILILNIENKTENSKFEVGSILKYETTLDNTDTNITLSGIIEKIEYLNENEVRVNIKDYEFEQVFPVNSMIKDDNGLDVGNVISITRKEGIISNLSVYNVGSEYTPEFEFCIEIEDYENGVFKLNEEVMRNKIISFIDYSYPDYPDGKIIDALIKVKTNVGRIELIDGQIFKALNIEGNTITTNINSNVKVDSGVLRVLI